MLEAPECHKTVQFLREHMLGTSIIGWDIVDGPYLSQFPQGYSEVSNIINKNNLIVDNIYYTGNLIIIEVHYDSELKGHTVIYILHHICHDSEWTLQPQDTSKWHIKLNNKRTCWFSSENDSSKLRFTKSKKIVECQKAKFGIDVLSSEFSLRKFKLIINEYGNLNITIFLTTDSIIAGIHSSMKSRVLHNAGISPLRKVQELKDQEIEKLYQAIRVIGGLLANNVSLDDEDFLGVNMDVYSDSKIKKIKTPDGDITYWNPHTQL